ncbi:MAG: hypothetical protein GY811_28780 [Myxococcales bacterium]|nr:hypothetical protein [Myxococcales bacterium]
MPQEPYRHAPGGRALLVTLACAVLCALPGFARAEEGLVGILSIDTSGVSDATAEQFEAQVEQALEGVGRHSVDRKALRERLQGSEFMEGCYFGPCLTALRVASGVPLVLVARIQGEGSSYSFVITLVDTNTGMFTAQVAQSCAVCTVDEAIMTATLATIALLSSDDPSGEMGNAMVAGTSKAGAKTPGKDNAKSSSIGPVRTAGWLFLGIGIAAAAAGGYLLLDDERRDLAIAGVASGSALFASGATVLLFSRQY